MPKKILFESAVHQFLWAGKRLQEHMTKTDTAGANKLANWINALEIDNPGSGFMRIAWTKPARGEYRLKLENAHFYTRGDTDTFRKKQSETGLAFNDDCIMSQNMKFFDGELRVALGNSGLLSEVYPNSHVTAAPGSERKYAEEIFHDEWAASVDVNKINVRQMNEACTAPEMRYIRSVLGDLRGRTLLDVGCGLGEAAVYFALLGAEVTATDISPGMCDAAVRLATANGVKIKSHVSAAEDLGFAADIKFDIIYTGNTLHHVDCATTMPRLVKHLRANGTFVSWDPVAYNPIINIYRRRAMKVRTENESPLKLSDIRAIRGHFCESNTAWFWLSTLLIFCIMAVIQRRNPNQERYWKSVIEEADDWAWLYRPLEMFDRVLLLIPFLRPLSWNVVIVGHKPKAAT